MDFPIHIDTICMGSNPFKMSQNFLYYDVFLSLKVVLILANCADPDEMQHYAAFHLGLHCLPKYHFKGFHNNNPIQLMRLWFMSTT